jgi:uncharacterized membrane protein YesL
MNGFFSMDGPFYKVGSLIADIMILSFFWILFSIPIITIGTSTTALYYVMTRRISNREGYLFRDFWISFKSNFKQTTIIWIIFLVIINILIINIRNIDLVGSMKTVIYPVQICFLIEVILCLMYVMPINARFEIGLKDSFKTAFFMANRHLLTSIGCVLIAGAIVVFTMATIILGLVAIGIYVYLTSFLFLRIFKKYRPEIDQDPLLMSRSEAANSTEEIHYPQDNTETDGGLDAGSQQTE